MTLLELGLRAESEAGTGTGTGALVVPTTSPKTKSIGYCGFLSLFDLPCDKLLRFRNPSPGVSIIFNDVPCCIFITAGSKRGGRVEGVGQHCVVNSVAPVPIAFDRQTDPKRSIECDYDLSVSVHITGIPQSSPQKETLRYCVQSSINKELTQFKLTCI